MVKGSNDCFGWMLNGIGRHALLSPEEEVSLGRQVRAWQNHPGGPCLLYTSPSPRDLSTSRMPSSA